LKESPLGMIGRLLRGEWSVEEFWKDTRV